MADGHGTNLSTPLGPGVFAFLQLTGRDEISGCFRFDVAMVSEDRHIDPAKLLGKPLGVEIEERHVLHGLISEFRLVAVQETRARYEATIRPWFWFSGQNADCRIFQNLSAVEIIEEIFAKNPDAKFEKRLQGSYPSREYCVQYDETDLDFAQRLMEDEGIFYFFEHTPDGHTMVLADSVGALKPVPGAETIPFGSEPVAPTRDRDRLTEWIPESAVRPGIYGHTSYDFTKPALDLMARSEADLVPGVFKGEFYRHQGCHLELDRGDALAAVRREELQAAHVRVRAEGRVRGPVSGNLITLEDHPLDSQNEEYLVIGAEHQIVEVTQTTGPRDGRGGFQMRYQLAPSRIPFRPERRTRQPVMRGPQTATVVGPGGEEIFTDEYGRVKVQFHWDRLGKRDENSSCFVRVSQTWAGGGWGYMDIPRIGQEVVVDFLEGDPDRPLITGRVYNAAQMPPYALPGNATQSGWKSNSSPGGGGWNELRFEDKAGSEEVYFQAQKDHNLLIKNDRSKLVQHDQSDRIDNNAKHSVGVDLDEDVGNNKTTSVGVDRSVKIGSNDTEEVGVNRSLTVGADETITVGANSSETIGANHSQSVGAAQTITVAAARSDTVGGAESRTVGAARQVTVGLAQSHTVGADDVWSVGADQTITVKSDQSLSVGAGRSTKIGKDDVTEVAGSRALKIGKGSVVEVAEDGAIKIGKALLIEAGDAIVLKTGSASISMKKDGTITIEGKDITIKGSGKINVKASSDVTIKGSKINQN
jgi:type VI secretion system secreted protein VgrG